MPNGMPKARRGGVGGGGGGDSISKLIQDINKGNWVGWLRRAKDAGADAEQIADLRAAVNAQKEREGAGRVRKAGVRKEKFERRGELQKRGFEHELQKQTLDQINQMERLGFKAKAREQRDKLLHVFNLEDIGERAKAATALEKIRQEGRQFLQDRDIEARAARQAMDIEARAARQAMDIEARAARQAAGIEAQGEQIGMRGKEARETLAQRGEQAITLESVKAENRETLEGRKIRGRKEVRGTSGLWSLMLEMARQKGRARLSQKEFDRGVTEWNRQESIRRAQREEERAEDIRREAVRLQERAAEDRRRTKLEILRQFKGRRLGPRGQRGLERQLGLRRRRKRHFVGLGAPTAGVGFRGGR